MERVHSYAGISCDSRAIKPGMIFAALPGYKQDGRQFISEAVANGATAVLTTPDAQNIPVHHIKTDNPRKVYAQMVAQFYPRQPDMLVAVTGTNGKSSTVDFLRQIWTSTGSQAASMGTLGVCFDSKNTILTHTTPEAHIVHQTLSELVMNEVSHVAFEASSHGLEQYRLDGVRIQVAGFSNLTQDHLDYHTDMEDYFQSKYRLFKELLPVDGRAVVNVDGIYGQRLAELCTARDQHVLRVGWSGSDIRLAEIMPGRYDQKIELYIQGRRYKLNIGLLGEFQIVNAILALGLAMASEVDMASALDAVQALQSVPGRLQFVGQTLQGGSVIVDFAHTEGGLENLLRSVRPHIPGRIILVFGCGGERDRSKRERMGQIAGQLADYVIVTDDNPRHEDAAQIRRAILKGCSGAQEIGDRGEAIGAAVEILQAQDCVVIAGKGHEQTQIIGDRAYPFCDVQVARAALAEKS